MGKRQRTGHGTADGSIAKRLKSRRQRQRLSPLERLPTEIIQQILIYSLNPDLPLVSKQLAQSLNSLHLMKEMLYQAWAQHFEPPIDPDAWSDGPPRRNISGPAAVLHARLIQCRFFTWPVCWEVSSRLAALIKSPLKDADLTNYAAWQEDEWALSTDNFRRGEDARDPAYWANCRAFCWLWARNYGVYMIPARLLRGPWTPDDRMMLQFFKDMDYGGYYVAARHQVISIIRDAVRLADEIVLRTLAQSMLWPESDRISDGYDWLPPLVTEAFLRHPSNIYLHQDVIEIFVLRCPRCRMSAAELLERETWDWLDANYRTDNHARRLKKWIGMYDEQVLDGDEGPLLLQDVGVDVT